jgi:hypothetical protein
MATRLKQQDNNLIFRNYSSKQSSAIFPIAGMGEVSVADQLI